MIEKISAKKAKEIMDTNPFATIVDVRNEDEYLEGHNLMLFYFLY